MIRIAVIADPHVHDTKWKPSGTGLSRAIRSYGETAASTRVFNESIPAFRAALTCAAEQGAKIVLLVGDLTDDGQAPNIRAAMALIAEFRDRYGLRVLAVPGNHDFFAVHGRPQTKTFLNTEGEAQRVSSRDCCEATTLGTEAALRMMQGLGYQPEAQDLHWESPFGCNPDWASRSYEVTSPDGSASCQMIDASYLIEPMPGLWVLAIDANVCVPRNGAVDMTDRGSFTDPGKAGWDAVLDHRSHVLTWMADVAARARTEGKQLVAFSHYPPVDVLAGTGHDELQVLNLSGLAARTPADQTAAAFAATGVRLHFSGHLHVNDTALGKSASGQFCNIAVPSPVGFRPGLKIVDLQDDRVEVRSLTLDEVPGYNHCFFAYRKEALREGISAGDAADAPDYATFLDRHLVALVHGRYLPREWPEDMRDFVAGGSLADLRAILGLEPDTMNVPLTTVVEDWYRLRKAGNLARRHIPPARLAAYHTLCQALPNTTGDNLPARFRMILHILKRYLERLPNADFGVDLVSMTVVERCSLPFLRG